MFRKALFLGLTLVLGAALVMLILRARSEEKLQLASTPPEIVKTAKSSSTRVFSPADLELAESTVLISPRANNGNQPQNGTYRITIRNHGEVDYHDLMLRVVFLGRSGQILETGSQEVPATIPAGGEFTTPEITPAEKVPGAVRCRLSILHADIGPAPGPESSQAPGKE